MPRVGHLFVGLGIMLVVLVVYDYVYENVYMFTFPGGTPRGAHTERTAGGCPVKSVCPCVCRPPRARPRGTSLVTTDRHRIAWEDGVEFHVLMSVYLHADSHQWLPAAAFQPSARYNCRNAALEAMSTLRL